VRLLPERELAVTFQTGKQKAGGQNVNRIKSAVRMKHLPTGLSVFINGRDQGANRREALRILSARVAEHQRQQAQQAYGELRQSHLGSRGRGGKIRTYCFLRQVVTDHRTGRSADIKSIMKGKLGLVR
jgi:peptide chain release factor 1